MLWEKVEVLTSLRDKAGVQQGNEVKQMVPYSNGGERAHTRGVEGIINAYGGGG